MSSFDSRGDSAGRSPHAAVADHLPTVCPACRSSSISTVAKNPNTESYWRCSKCGEVWNDARRHNAQESHQPRWPR